MIIIPAVLCAAAMLKLVSISNAIRWLGGDAKYYRKQILASNPQTVLALETYLKTYHADFFPITLYTRP